MTFDGIRIYSYSVETAYRVGTVSSLIMGDIIEVNHGEISSENMR
jgi:hypothetical protein